MTNLGKWEIINGRERFSSSSGWNRTKIFGENSCVKHSEALFYPGQITMVTRLKITCSRACDPRRRSQQRVFGPLGCWSHSGVTLVSLWFHSGFTRVWISDCVDVCSCFRIRMDLLLWACSCAVFKYHSEQRVLSFVLRPCNHSGKFIYISRVSTWAHVSLTSWMFH